MRASVAECLRLATDCSIAMPWLFVLRVSLCRFSWVSESGTLTFSGRLLMRMDMDTLLWLCLCLCDR